MKKFIIFLFVLAPVALCARVKLPSVIGDNMVLQREDNVLLWGWSEPGRSIQVQTGWSSEIYTTVTDDEGEWALSVDTPGAGGPYEIIFNDGDTLRIRNVLIGEVWLCSGQSNMQMPMKGFDSQPVKGSIDVLMNASANSSIRLFHTGIEASSFPKEDCQGIWQESSMSSASCFSAVGYYFGLYLSQALGIPIGLIESDCGATRIEAWMSEKSALGVDSEILKTNKDYDATNKVSSLYNSMILPLAKYNLRGFIWYQGESNKGYHKTYASNMEAMVRNWREIWGKGDAMPFYYVQLAPFDYDIPMHRFKGKKNGILLPLMVEAQLAASEVIPNSAIAVNTDSGSPADIHPSGKDLVGRRLALLALCGTYGFSGIDCTGPRYESCEFSNGRAVVTFKTQSTLFPIDVPIFGFEIAGEDRVFHEAEAFVMHEDYDFSRKVEVHSEKVPNPVAVRYAFRNVVDKVNLVNTAGLPAFPFRSDDWDDVDPTLD